MSFPRALPVGDRALTLELGESIDVGLAARVQALDAALQADTPRGLVEWAPTYRSLFVVYDPEQASFEQVRDGLLSRLGAPAGVRPRVRHHEIPVRYDGPDLEDVARLSGLGVDGVIARHTGVTYTALMLGFLPGFAYLGPLDAALALPRRATPRPRVPAGSVGIAEGQTGVYPGNAPGGWHLLGTSAVPIFDPSRDPPALVQAGDSVRFRASADLPSGPAPPLPAEPARAALEVLDPGTLALVQGPPRRGYRRHGVSAGGAADPEALTAANLAVGNPRDAAVLECCGAGLRLRFLAPTCLAWWGADLGAVLDRSDLGAWPVPGGRLVRARAGNVLRLTARRRGFRTYLAFAGGLAVPRVLGSTATDLVGGFGGLGGRSLRVGDRLALGSEPLARSLERPVPDLSDDIVVRAVPGPQQDAFSESTLKLFFQSRFRMAATSDRVGARLEGPALCASRREIVSDGMLPGCVQVTPDGQPLVMLADAPCTGGYPKIATVVTADLPLLAQLVPEEGHVSFRKCYPPVLPP